MLNAKIEELIEQGKYLYQTYSLWLQVSDPRENEKYQKCIEENKEFFGVISESLFASVVTTIACLCDKERSDVLSLYGVLGTVAAIRPEIEKSVLANIRPYEPELEALIQLRHKVYAHRDRNICPELVFRSVNITPERIHSCISAVIDAIEQICSGLGIRAKSEALMEILNTSLEMEASLAKILR